MTKIYSRIRNLNLDPDPLVRGMDPRIRISNGNDIETKRNDTSIIGVFSVSKRKEPTYSRTWRDRSKANTITNILCRIEEKTNRISLRLCSIEAKRRDLIKIYAGSDKNVLV